MQKRLSKNLTNYFITGTLGITLATSAVALNPLTIQLSAKQVVTENSKTVLKNITKAKSGDVIQYQASYTNNLDKPMTDVMINIPVPASMVYTGTASPMPTQASLDGKKFEAVPLKRQVKGKWVEVPLSEYRVVRWVIKTLPAKQQATATVNLKAK